VAQAPHTINSTLNFTLPSSIINGIGNFILTELLFILGSQLLLEKSGLLICNRQCILV